MNQLSVRIGRYVYQSHFNEFIFLSNIRYNVFLVYNKKTYTDYKHTCASRIYLQKSVYHNLYSIIYLLSILNCSICISALIAVIADDIKIIAFK